MFAYAAEENGVVVSLDDKGIIVLYASGIKRGVELGRRFGNAEGSVYPHDIITNLKLNSKFVKGDIIAYNSGVFEQDILNPKNVVWKSSLLTMTAMLETVHEHEDSCTISKDLGNRLTTKTTKVRSIVVTFDQSITNLVKVGTELLPSDYLCIIQDAVTENSGMLDEDTIYALTKFSKNAPKAKYRSIVDRIEVLYHGDKDDMSKSLRSLANQSDVELKSRAKSVGGVEHTGEVNSDYRVAGNPLALDTAEIKIYLTLSTNSGVADKLTFSGQLKSTISNVMTHSLTTENGVPVDATFGCNSLLARIVESGFIIGTTNTLLLEVGKQALAIYKGK